jgi:hypothetical protein
MSASTFQQLVAAVAHDMEAVQERLTAMNSNEVILFRKVSF